MTEKTNPEGFELVPLIEPMGSCHCCKHQDECDSIRKHIQSCFNMKYRFRCPIIIEVDENIVYHKYEPNPE